MALETVTHISDLVVTNPTSTDPKSQGDDHLRNLKIALKTDLPNITGPVTSSQAELNIMDGVTASTAEINILDGVTASTAEINLLDGVTASTAEINQLAGITGPAAAKDGETYTGTHNFTGATPTAPTPPQADNSTTIATTSYVTQKAFSAALPAQSGKSILVTDGTNASWSADQTGNSGKYLTTNGATPSWATILPPQVIRVPRTSNTILDATNNQNLIDITSGTFSQTFTAAATLGSGWYCWIRNSGTGDVTLDPNGSETIDGLTSFIMYTGEARLVQCDGTNFNSIVVSPFSRTFTASGTFTKPPGYSAFHGLLWSAGASGGKGASAGGGGGGACLPFVLSAASVGTTETITIGAGGAAQTTANSNGSSGGNSSLGSLVTSYGGAFGNGTGGQKGGAGGRWQGAPLTTGESSDYLGAVSGSYFAAMGGAGGAGFVTTGFTSGKNADYGGGGGGQSATIAVAGGPSTYGGGGGGGSGAGATTGGTSVFGGAGGAGNSGAVSGTDGTAPGGGGGATNTGTQSGAGARGELRIWGGA